MGNKIITEKDFWTCTGGLMPTQFQSGQSLAKKKSGAKYITKMDTATVSFADFSCKKLMFIAAILAAVVAVAVVATGGAALIAIGALAGAAGAAAGAVLGSLLCGQMVAKVRQWLAGKENFKILGIPTITGDHQMLCPLFGDQITFAPEIKTWGQALAKGGANLIGGILEGMMAGALIGTGGALLSGGRAALTSGGVRGLGQAGFNFLKSAPSNIMSNFGQGLFNGVGFKLVDGATNWLNTYGDTGQASTDDFREGVKNSTFGDAAAIKSIFTTGGTMQDWVTAAMLLTPGGKKGNRNHHNSHITTPDAPHGKPKGDADGSGKPKEGDADSKKQDGDDGNTPPRSHVVDAQNAGKRDGEAFEASSKPKYSPNVKKWEAKGGKVEILDGDIWRYTDWEGNVVDYKNGHPDFSPYARQSVDIGKQEGNHTTDYTNAQNKSTKIPPKEDGTTWHHHEDGKTMQEIDKKIHERFSHHGGVSKAKK
jgi:hypothetical protein